MTNKMSKEELTQREIDILKHTLGADSRYKKKDWGFRNHFCCNQDDIILNGLVEKGLMRKASSHILPSGSCYFFATEEACTLLGFYKTKIEKMKKENNL